MKYRRLGNSGLKLSEVGLGSWVTFGKQIDLSTGKQIMQEAYDAGINFFDNAEGYEEGEAERLMGDAIASLGWSRDTFVLSSKAFWGGEKPTQKGLSRKHIFDACHAALKRLRVDYLDLYYCHRPDIDTPIRETVWAMHDLVSQGKVMYWGTSEWNAQQITEAISVAKADKLHMPIVEQPEYNLLKRDKVEGEYRPLYALYGLGLTTFSPLASGRLTGKYSNGIPKGSRLDLPEYAWLKELFFEDDSWVQKVKLLSQLASQYDIPLHHLALKWVLANPNVSSVILGVSKLSQLTDNLSALAREPLDSGLINSIESIVDNKPNEPQRF
ncbi:aldo/keto reductase [Alteromonas sediminis]|uniref:Aldo/keto reductase n=1 Tax=Alteromonas sediminis TaxID=2259342 RepID=A0A3N5ZDH6_9ALTE|nr:aldo/keto reductase [Alteromonas sediminis]RPJ68158.1 aldo/keto reductase [Alteromonas sediminis]